MSVWDQNLPVSGAKSASREISFEAKPLNDYSPVQAGITLFN
jgi:hypothetical protein